MQRQAEFRQRKHIRQGQQLRRRKVCAFCADKTTQIDYKEVNRLRRYLSERAKIEPSFGVRAAYDGADMTDGQAIAAMIAKAEADFGSLDILTAGVEDRLH